jgi:hypothetical protein
LAHWHRVRVQGNQVLWWSLFNYKKGEVCSHSTTSCTVWLDTF